MTATSRVEKQILQDRTDLACYLRNSNSSAIGYAWCGVHECRPGTCFPMHYPEAFAKKRSRSRKKL